MIVLNIKMPKEIITGSINKYLDIPKPRGERPRLKTTKTENIVLFVIAKHTRPSIEIDNELKIENKSAIDLLLWRIFFKNARIYGYNGKYPPIKG